MSFLNTHTGFRGLSGEDLGGSGFKDVEGKGEGEGETFHWNERCPLGRISLGRVECLMYFILYFSDAQKFFGTDFLAFSFWL